MLLLSCVVQTFTPESLLTNQYKLVPIKPGDTVKLGRSPRPGKK